MHKWKYWERSRNNIKGEKHQGWWRLEYKTQAHAKRVSANCSQVPSLIQYWDNFQYFMRIRKYRFNIKFWLLNAGNELKRILNNFEDQAESIYGLNMTCGPSIFDFVLITLPRLDNNDGEVFEKLQHKRKASVCE